MFKPYANTNHTVPLKSAGFPFTRELGAKSATSRTTLLLFYCTSTANPSRQQILEISFHSEYLNEPNAGSAFVNRDFVSTRLEPQEIQSLLALFTSGTISQETLLNQLSAGEILGDDFDVEDEIETTQNGGLTEREEPDAPAEEPADTEDE